MNQSYILSAKDDGLIEKIHNTVQGFGYCIVRGLGLKHFDDIQRNQKLFDFLSQLGRLTSHKDDDFKSVFWDVKYRGDNYVVNNDVTFSEDVGECPLHSDSSLAKIQKVIWLCM
ncbi:hypothetical protein [Moraxella oculi]|uniref:TauD/TfdA-like domain-containing protein n=1 Tax=Moraxella oculi TaxID=2940516 RepID=A0ABW8U604_9GAMM